MYTSSERSSGCALVDAQGAHGIQGVQHQLAVAEIHALRVAGGAGGVEQRGDRVLVEIGKVVLVRAWDSNCSYSPSTGSEVVGRLVFGELQIAFDGGQPTWICSTSGRKSSCTSTRSSSAWFMVNSTCSGDRRMFTVCSTAPIIGTAKKHSR